MKIISNAGPQKVVKQSYKVYKDKRVERIECSKEEMKDALKSL